MSRDGSFSVLMFVNDEKATVLHMYNAKVLCIKNSIDTILFLTSNQTSHRHLDARATGMDTNY